MAVLSMIIIWCDTTFENARSYQSMKHQFNETASGASNEEVDPIDMCIFSEGIKEFHSHNIPLIAVQTPAQAEHQINEHKSEKIFLICSGTLGRYFVPKIAQEYPYVQNIYIYAHNLLLHVNWADEYIKLLKMFDFHTTLLVRLTRDISKHFIERGKMFLTLEAPEDALTCFEHAHKLEIAANKRDRMSINHREEEQTYFIQPDFREHLDLLEGQNGFIDKAKTAIQNQGHSLESS